MTRSEAENIDGMCMRCKEWTTLAEPCCNAGVWAEGHVYHLEDIEDDEEQNDVKLR